MSSFMRAMSAMLFLIGCLVCLCGVTYVWCLLLVGTVKINVWLGWLSMLSFAWMRLPIEGLWRAWHRLWAWTDGMLFDRLARFPGGGR